MSIKTTNINDFIQDFTVKKEDKLFYGEIYSPFSLIKSMLSLFNPSVFTNPNAKWLDTGAGTGYFSMVLFDLLNKGLLSVITNDEERKTHIIERMLYLIELKPENVITLRERFGPQANIIEADYLSFNDNKLNDNKLIYFDYIIGNPPYNSHGMKKVPTNTSLQKTQDGQTIWHQFIKKSLSLLKPEVGQLCYIVPSIWLKPDKAGLYNLLTQYKIEKLHCLTNTETNKLFNGEAQTPTCYFLLTNTLINNKTIHIYDKCRETYINYYYTIGIPIPLTGQSIIKKIQPFIEKAGSPIKVLKTNMPSKKSILSNTYDAEHSPYPNISTCKLVKTSSHLQPELLVNYSNIPQAYHNDIKLVLAHKMYGFPYLDTEGKYGISNRDNYIILSSHNNKTIEDLKQLQAFLSTKFALYVYEATRYRMKYLEKYAFELLPDINNLSDFPKAEDINDKTLATYFGLDSEDQQNIQNLHKRHIYGRFI